MRHSVSRQPDICRSFCFAPVFFYNIRTTWSNQGIGETEKCVRVFVPGLDLKNSLRYFPHATPKFYVKSKSLQFFSIFDRLRHSHYSLFCVVLWKSPKRQSGLKCEIDPEHSLAENPTKSELSDSCWPPRSFKIPQVLYFLFPTQLRESYKTAPTSLEYIFCFSRVKHQHIRTLTPPYPMYSVFRKKTRSVFYVTVTDSHASL